MCRGPTVLYKNLSLWEAYNRSIHLYTEWIAMPFEILWNQFLFCFVLSVHGDHYMMMWRNLRAQCLGCQRTGGRGWPQGHLGPSSSSLTQRFRLFIHLILLTQFLLSLLRPLRPCGPRFSLTAFPENVLDFASQFSTNSDPTAKTALPSGAGDKITKRPCIL